MTHATQIIDVRNDGTLSVHGLDDETKATLGFLARYKGHTLEDYERDLRKFHEWTWQIGLLRMLDCERFHLELYVGYLTDRGLAPATVCRMFGTVRGWFHFAHVDGLIKKDPAAYVKTPKVEQDQQRRTWFETVDMALVLRAATDPRDRALLRLMYDLALRVGELCALDVGSIHRTPMGVYLQFIGKGNKLATMQIPPASLYALDDYLAASGRIDGPLFVNRYGNRIRRVQVQDIVTRVATAAGVTGYVTCHGIRRTHARDVILRGGSYDDAAEDLRHHDSRVTKACYAVSTGAGDLGRLKASAAMASLAQ